MTRALSFIIAAILAGTVVAQSKPQSLYTLSSAGSQWNTTPDGEVFTCTVCGWQVQIQIEVAPPLTAKAPFRTNEKFLTSVRTPEQRRSFAEGIVNRPPISGPVTEPSWHGIAATITGVFWGATFLLLGMIPYYVLALVM